MDSFAFLAPLLELGIPALLLLLLWRVWPRSDATESTQPEQAESRDHAQS